ncbi:MAG: ABC transporter permease subunit [Hyphomicrobiaceae bacterium]|nr:ABC transporter permease subunit [Hyphomicrobiaceae bacterium]
MAGLAPPTAGGGNAAPASSQNGWTQRIVILVPYVWLLVFFLIPFFIVLKISLSEQVRAAPPYAPVFDILTDPAATTLEKLSMLGLGNFGRIFSDTLYIEAYLTSVVIAGISTFATLLIGYPIAYGMARAPREWRATLLMMVILPFWTSFLIRVYAWIGILADEGLLNNVLMGLGLIDEPLHIMSTNYAVMIGIVYSYLPFMILPLYSALEKMDDTLLEAAQDLGCTPFKSFWLVTFPLSLPGVIAGCFLVFIPAVGEFVIPDLLGGSETLMIGRTLWEEFSSNTDWPLSAAVAILLLLLLVVPIVIFQNQQAKMQESGR